jgi:AAA domain
MANIIQAESAKPSCSGTLVTSICVPIDLCRSAVDVALLTERCEALSSPSLIVIDTLSRVMAGGNENASDDMGRFVTNATGSGGLQAAKYVG